MKQQGKYVYHGWPSKNKFYCKGRLISGPDRKYFFLTLVFLLVPFAVSLYVISSIMKNFSIGWIFYVIETYLFAINLSSFFLSAFMDPGIIPRRPSPPINESNPFDNPVYPVSKNIKIVDVPYSIKYCDTCNIYRPARCIHCGICNNCVDRFDHHCPWVGNCIGKRNYNTFLVFVYGVALNSLFLIGLSITDMILRHNHYKNEGKSSPFILVLKNPVSFILGLYCLLAHVLVGILGIYHCKIIKRGVTTNENIKRIFEEKNPYSKNCIKNWISVCFPPRYPKFVKYHNKIQKTENV